jgi:hypothetical protein
MHGEGECWPPVAGQSHTQPAYYFPNDETVTFIPSPASSYVILTTGLKHARGLLWTMPSFYTVFSLSLSETVQTTLVEQSRRITEIVYSKYLGHQRGSILWMYPIYTLAFLPSLIWPPAKTLPNALHGTR